MLRFFCTFVLSVTFSVAICQPRQLIETFMSKGSIPGLFVAVVKGDTVLYQQSFGFADKENSLPLTDTTCMELGSISKIFTAEVIYELVGSGKISVKDPIRKFLPLAPPSWSGITIHHLLTHTSGIQNYLLDPRFFAAEYFTNQSHPAASEFFSAITPDSMVQMFYSLPLEFEPSLTWSYSNTGYYLLGKIGEVTTGKPFFQLVADKVTAPLGMKRTHANENARRAGCLAKGYFPADSSLVEARFLHSNYAFSAGAWATTGEDMIRFLKANHKRRLPSDKSQLDLRKPHTKHILPFTYEGGRFFTTFHGLTITSHNGGTPGFSSSWINVVDKNLSVILLMNRQDYAPIDQLAWDVLSYFDPALTYPEKERHGADEVAMSQKLLALLTALKTNAPFPNGLSKPLLKFLLTENGKGYWRWYFERGFPVNARCVDVEKTTNANLYRFILSLSDDIIYRLSILANKDGEIMQMRWW